MPTKGDLQNALDDARAMCEAAADVLADPELTDRAARVEALNELGFIPPSFLADADQWAEEGGWEAES